MSVARDLVWDGCSNVRDLGGHATGDGGTTRFGAVVRSDSRAHLTDAGWTALLAYGVSRIVDLRRDDELADDPPRAAEVEVVHVSLMAGIERGDPGWTAMVVEAEAAPDALGEYVVFYDWMLERCAPAIVRALAAVASAPPGAVVVHCVGGKDRTGLVAALLLRLCGVSVDGRRRRLRPDGDAAPADAGRGGDRTGRRDGDRARPARAPARLGRGVPRRRRARARGGRVAARPPLRMSRVLAIFGPTASGKTDVAEAIADRIPAALVSADAMQAYRGLPILTNQSARPTALVGVWPLSHDGSLAEYQELAHRGR